MVEGTPQETQVNDNDKLWSLLSWIPWFGWILAIIALLMEPQKDRPFVRYNAIQALATNAVLVILEVIFSVLTVGIGGCILLILWIALIYPAIKAYQGEWVTVPLVTDFCKNQGWI